MHCQGFWQDFLGYGMCFALPQYIKAQRSCSTWWNFEIKQTLPLISLKLKHFIYPKFAFLYLVGFFKTITLISIRNILSFDGSLDAMVLLNLIHKRFQQIFSQGLPLVFYPQLWSFSWGPANRNRVLPWLPWSYAELHQLSLCPSVL